ncbi:outer membrane protein [Helicobacter felis]|uniref:outer membrane protein n=1 Tax=Helicobacter felis TaxID=214 RepID=UPI001F2CCACA|nr:outer membrane protein [Helicobacter felis]
MRLALLAVLVVGLSAESSGFYIQAGFQYSNVLQDNVASKTDIQALNTAVNFNKAFPSKHQWNAPQAGDIPFKDPVNNPFQQTEKILDQIIDWDGKNLDMDMAKADYQKNAEQLMPAWLAYTIESAQKETPNAPNKVIGNMLSELGNFAGRAMMGYQTYRFQNPQLEAAYKAFNTVGQQAAQALGMGSILLLSHDEGQASLAVLQAQVSNLESAANTLSSTLFNVLTSASSNQQPLIDNPNQRRKFSAAIQSDADQVSVLAQALQKVLKERYGISPAMQHRYSNSNLYGVNVQMGYKQFFGSSKRWGLRYYGSFSYNWGEGSKTGHGINSVIYGAGIDGLFNFFESGSHGVNAGVFLGLMVVGNSWINNNTALKTSINACKNDRACTLQMRSSYFQLPLTFGFRTNIGAHNGFEIGTRIPLLPMPYYYASMATSYGILGTYKQQIGFKRNASVYFNYVFSF